MGKPKKPFPSFKLLKWIQEEALVETGGLKPTSWRFPSPKLGADCPKIFQCSWIFWNFWSQNPTFLNTPYFCVPRKDLLLASVERYQSQIQMIQSDPIFGSFFCKPYVMTQRPHQSPSKCQPSMNAKNQWQVSLRCWICCFFHWAWWFASLCTEYLRLKEREGLEVDMDTADVNVIFIFYNHFHTNALYIYIYIYIYILGVSQSPLSAENESGQTNDFQSCWVGRWNPKEV